MSPFLKLGFEKFFDSDMYNYTGKLKIITGTDLTHAVKMNELFSPAASASQVHDSNVWGWQGRRTSHVPPYQLP